MVELLADKPADSTAKRQQALLGHPVCQNAFRKFLNLGSARYTRLKRAAAAGERAPLDGRCHSQKVSFDSRNAQHKEKREVIHEFLEELYQTVSEPMPEANQSTKRKSAEVNIQKKKKKPLKGKGGAVTPASGVDTEPTTACGEGPSQPMKFRRHRGRRPKMAAQWHRGGDKSEMRLLPPGSFSDYLAVLKDKEPKSNISLKLFTKAPCLVPNSSIVYSQFAIIASLNVVPNGCLYYLLK